MVHKIGLNLCTPKSSLASPLLRPQHPTGILQTQCHPLSYNTQISSSSIGWSPLHPCTSWRYSKTWPLGPSGSCPSWPSRQRQPSITRPQMQHRYSHHLPESQSLTSSTLSPHYSVRTSTRPALLLHRLSSHMPLIDSPLLCLSHHLFTPFQSSRTLHGTVHGFLF